MIVRVTGDALDAPLTAALLARFVVEPTGVHLDVTGPAPGGELVMRAKTRRLLSSLGMDYANMGRSANVWSKADLPLEKGALIVPSDTLARALATLCKSIGITGGEGGDLLVDTSLDMGWAGERIGLRSQLGPRRGLHLLLLSKAVDALIATFPDGEDTTLEAAEFMRRMRNLNVPVMEMAKLLDGAPDPHRAQLFADCGRHVSLDDDPFTEAEWARALIAAGVPQGRSVLERLNA